MDPKWLCRLTFRTASTELADAALQCGYTSISSFLSSISFNHLTVIEGHWARTVKSPDPAFRHVDVPLTSTVMLSTKPGKEAWVEPVLLTTA